MSAPDTVAAGSSAGPRAPRPSASVLLLRDHEDGLQVLMLRRAERGGDIRSGLAVFPGGVLDARDREAHGFCTGLDDAAASARLQLPEGGLDYYVAALRESFEEVGLLLALQAAGGRAEPAAVAALAGWRERLNRGDVGIAELCTAAGLRLDAASLQYHSHWLTPPGRPQRFDTRFFAARAPEGQLAQVDGGEAQALMWLTPQQALQRERGLKLLPVTARTLQDLARFPDADAALAEAGARREVKLIMPRLGRVGQGEQARERIVLPSELPWAEIGRLDPEGRGDVAAELVAGVPVRLSERVIRVTAPNPGPMTGPGTNSYLVRGAGATEAGWTLIDPGPAMPEHGRALLAAAEAAGGRITRILVTHTHRDHSPLAAELAAATGAPVWGRVAAHPMWQDTGFQAAHEPRHGELIALGGGESLRVIHTPGHASNHLCYLLESERLLFTGDHVMQGSTVVINPPDGDMAAYLRSLGELLHEPLDWLAPGHGFLVAEPHAVLRALIAHRLRREAKVAQRLAEAGEADLATLVGLVYDDVPAALHGVARRSLLAHLLKLQGEGRVARGEGGYDADATRWRHIG